MTTVEKVDFKKIVKANGGSIRITIPKHLAEKLPISDYVIIEVENGKITIYPAEIKKIIKYAHNR